MSAGSRRDKPNGRPSRGSTRFRAAIHAELNVGGTDHDCQVVNLSRTGVLLEGRLPSVPIGERVDCTLHAPVGDLRLTAAARVARAPDASRLAIEFQGLDERQRQTLEALINRILEGQGVVPLDDLRPGATEREIREALGKISVPHRISLAARGNPRDREYLRHDSHPQVLEALARNPNLIVPEVRELARSRHITVGVIEVLANDGRWKGDEELRITLATHTRVPVPLAERLLAGLSNAALRRALQRPGLSDLVRDRILRKLTRGK